MKKQISAILAAAAVTFSFTGCDISDDIENFMNRKPGESSEASEDEDKNSGSISDEYSYASIDDIARKVEKLIKNAQAPGNEETLRNGINELLNELDNTAEALAYINVRHYGDWDNDELEEAYENCYETYCITHNLLEYAFSNCYTVEEYSSLFEPYIGDEESLEYFTAKGFSIQRLIGYSKVDYELMYENIDRYFDIVYNSSTNDTLKNNSSAEVYIDILSIYDTEDLYEIYNRDFTPEEIMALSKVISEELLPVMNYIKDSLSDLPYYDEIYDNTDKFEDPFAVINEYAPMLSADIGASANALVSEKQYFAASGNNSYTGSFTVDLPVQNSALIYNYQYGDYYDLITAIHEFGHYNAARYCTIPDYLADNNIDIAEIQSQGMEMIFMDLYDDIYGDKADTMRMVKMCDTLDSVISGFLIGEFEYNVLTNLENMTAQDIVAYYDEIMKDYAPNSNFYYISHLFEQPGYYISYGVSALAALDIWEKSLTDSEGAVEMYENIARINCDSNEYQFKSAIEVCGFDNVLTEEYIRNIAAVLQNYADSIIK